MILIGLILFVGIVCVWLPFFAMPGLGIAAALPVIYVPGENLDSLGITNTMLAALVTSVGVGAFLFWVVSRRKDVPDRWQGIVEVVVEAWYGLARQSAGNRARWLLPLMLSIFYFVMIANVMKIIPSVDSVGELHCAGLTPNVEDAEATSEDFIQFSGYEVNESPLGGYFLKNEEALNAGDTISFNQYKDCKETLHDHSDELISRGDDDAIYLVRAAERAIVTDPIKEIADEVALVVYDRAVAAADDDDIEPFTEEEIAELLDEARVQVEEEATNPEHARELAEETLLSFNRDADEDEDIEARGVTLDPLSLNDEPVVLGDEAVTVDEIVEHALEEVNGLVESGEYLANFNKVVSEAIDVAEEAAEDEEGTAIILATVSRDVSKLHVGYLDGNDGLADRHKGTLPSDDLYVVTPFIRGATTDLSLTLAIAVVAMVMVQYFGIRELGVAGWGSKFINLPALEAGGIKAIDFAVGLLETVLEFAKIVSFAFRLFGAMFAGQILMFVILFLVATGAPILVIFLEVFVGLIQAFVFAILFLMFAVVAMTSHHDDDEHH